MPYHLAIPWANSKSRTCLTGATNRGFNQINYVRVYHEQELNLHHRIRSAVLYLVKLSCTPQELNLYVVNNRF